MKKANYLVLDCETGGLQPENNPITQIALIALNDDLKEIARYETYIAPYDGLKIEQAALDTTGLKMSDINNGLSKKEARKIIYAFIKKIQPNTHPSTKPIVVGHNVQFDIGFLNKLFEDDKTQFAELVSPTSIDTQALTKMKFPNISKLQLAVCCREMGVILEDAHKAMNDTEATVKLFIQHILALRGNQTQTSKVNTNEIPTRKFQF